VIVDCLGGGWNEVGREASPWDGRLVGVTGALNPMWVEVFEELWRYSLP
jgi:hypothetical protein